jgi:hypothetical protein
MAYKSKDNRSTRTDKAGRTCAKRSGIKRPQDEEFVRELREILLSPFTEYYSEDDRMIDALYHEEV